MASQRENERERERERERTRENERENERKREKQTYQMDGNMFAAGYEESEKKKAGNRIVVD
jgi:hypothetical protein